LLAAISLLVTVVPVGVTLNCSSPSGVVAPFVRLTAGEGTNLSPTFSPDGRYIAFSSNRSGSFDVWLMDTHGRKLVRLTTMPGDELGPEWSPDGRRIAFLVVDKQGTAVWTVNPRTLEAEVLATGIGIQEGFQWSPSGEMLSYVSKAGGSCMIVVVDVAGRSKQLTSPDYCSEFPSWSPDGGKIVFSSNQLGKAFDIWLMSADGSGMRQLTGNSGFNIKPRINPLDDRIVFLSNRTGIWDLWTMSADGANQSQVITTPGHEGVELGWKPDLGIDSSLMWDPSGLMITFSSTGTDDPADLFIVHPPEYNVAIETIRSPSYRVTIEDQTYGVAVEYGGIIVTRLSTPMSQEGFFMDNLNPCWSRDGKSIVFQAGRDGRYDIWLVSFGKPVSSYN
jgi:Tol biopolymer transport system component